MTESQMTHEALQELLGVYALDAVDPDEAAAVEAHLQECPKCRAEVEAHRSVATLLGNAGAPAPAGIWDRIAGELDDTPPAATPADDRVLSFPDGGRDTRPARRRPRIAVVLTAIAAAVIVVAGVAGVITIQRQQERVDDLAAQVSTTRDDRAAADALADPTSTIVRLTSPDEALTVRAVITDEGVGYLLGAPLPDADLESTYQLWGLAGTRAVSLGLLGREPGVFEFHVEDPVTRLAITTEQEGGADQPTNDPMVSGGITPRGADDTLTS